MFTSTSVCCRRSLLYFTRLAATTTTTTTTTASSSSSRRFFFFSLTNNSSFFFSSTQHSIIIMSEENQQQKQQQQRQSSSSSASASSSSSSSRNGRTKNYKRWKNKQKGGRGGGGGGERNNNNNIHHQQSNSRPSSYRPPNKTLLQVYTGHDDFYKMHMKCQQDMGSSFLGKYRVHKPQCNCFKINDIRKKINQGDYILVEKDDDDDDDKNKNNNNEQQQQQQQQQQNLQQEGDDDHVVVAKKETTSIEIDSLPSLDGLIVHPDVKSIQCIYYCRESNLETYESNPLEIESNLQRTMLSSLDPSSSSSSNNSNSNSNIKINGAICLLENEPNGFASVISSNEKIIDLVKDVTRKQIQYKKLNPNINLYADHGDFIMKLPQTLLFQLKHTKKQSLNKQQQIRDEILHHMSNQGICIHSEQQQEQDGGKKIEIKIGHHLDSLLHLISLSSKNQNQKKKNSSNNNKQDESNDGKDDIDKEEEEDDERYWLVYGHDETTTKKVSFEINIPGGKRHLGETCLEAAIRETEEEISLVWDERWIQTQYQNHQNISSKINRYYVLCPPDPAVLMAELEEREQE